MRTIKRILILLFIMGTFSVQAALHDRGNGLIYDDVLDITWSKDANPAGTQGLGVIWPSFGDDIGDVLGYMTLAEARDWIDTLNQSQYKGYSDWRLPKVSPLNSSEFVMGSTMTGCDGLICDYGYNIGAPGTAYPGSTASELAYMFHTNLGNASLVLPDGTSNTVTCAQETPYCLQYTGLLTNLTPDIYWTDQLASPTMTTLPGAIHFVYLMRSGRQSYISANLAGLVWPVRDGDISSVNSTAHAVPLFHWWVLVLLSIGIYLLAVMLIRKS